VVRRGDSLPPAFPPSHPHGPTRSREIAERLQLIQNAAGYPILAQLWWGCSQLRFQQKALASARAFCCRFIKSDPPVVHNKPPGNRNASIAALNIYGIRFFPIAGEAGNPQVVLLRTATFGHWDDVIKLDFVIT
jgi:hypothetical protein